MTDVMIVDDHHLIRIGVKNLLEGHFPDMNVAEAATLADAIALMGGTGSFDLVLLDINLPDVSALEGLTLLKLNSPSTAVALISGIEDHHIIRTALANGADGFIPKSADPQILIHAVSLILGGEIFLPRSYLKGENPVQADAPRINAPSVLSTLTARQNDVFNLMRQGLSNKEIARQLDLSESTIKSHISSILKEFGTTSRAKAIVKSNELGLTN